MEAAIRVAIGNGYRSVGEYQLAVSHLERAVLLRKTHLGSKNPVTLHTIPSLAGAYTDAGLHNEALALHAQSLEHFAVAFGSESASTATFLHSYARASLKAGKLGEAERLMRANLEIQRKNDGPTALGTAFSLGWLSRILLLEKKYEEAELLARESLSIHEREMANQWYRFVAMSLLGGALRGQEKYTEAEPLLLQGYEGLKKVEDTFGNPTANWRLTEAVQRIVDFYEATQQREKARAWREKLPANKNSNE